MKKVSPATLYIRALEGSVSRLAYENRQLRAKLGLPARKLGAKLQARVDRHLLDLPNPTQATPLD